MKFEGALRDVILEADKLPWRYWVYSEPFEKINGDVQCLVLDVDDVELGSDDFTPLDVEQKGYRELISVQDLQGVLDNIRLKNKAAREDVLIDAVEYFVKNDAYMS